MTQDTAHMPLDERGLEAAFKAAPDDWNCRKSHLQVIEAAIRAYLQTAAADVSGLVERLLAACIGHPYAKIAWPHRLLHEAASTIQTLSASNAALEAEIERLRGDMQRIIDAPLIDHSNPHNNPASIARAALSAPKGGQDHG